MMKKQEDVKKQRYQRVFYSDLKFINDSWNSSEPQGNFKKKEIPCFRAVRANPEDNKMYVWTRIEEPLDV